MHLAEVEETIIGSSESKAFQFCIPCARGVHANNSNMEINQIQSNQTADTNLFK